MSIEIVHAVDLVDGLGRDGVPESAPSVTVTVARFVLEIAYDFCHA